MSKKRPLCNNCDTPMRKASKSQLQKLTYKTPPGFLIRDVLTCKTCKGVSFSIVRDKNA